MTADLREQLRDALDHVPDDQPISIVVRDEEDVEHEATLSLVQVTDAGLVIVGDDSR